MYIKRYWILFHIYIFDHREMKAIKNIHVHLLKPGLSHPFLRHGPEALWSRKIIHILAKLGKIEHQQSLYIFYLKSSLSLRGLNFLSAVESWFLNQNVNANMNIQHEIGKIHHFLFLEMGLFFGPNLRDVTALFEASKKSNKVLMKHKTIEYIQLDVMKTYWH